MTLFKKIQFVIVVMVLAFCVGFFIEAQEVEPLKDTKAVSALQATIYQCGDITERAAAHLVAIVEFQKLEIAGRKARVFKLCMQDRGYIENISWLKSRTLAAAKTAKSTNVSVAEALENLRRGDMKKPTGERNRPTYWVRNSRANP